MSLSLFQKKSVSVVNLSIQKQEFECDPLQTKVSEILTKASLSEEFGIFVLNCTLPTNEEYFKNLKFYQVKKKQFPKYDQKDKYDFNTKIKNKKEMKKKRDSKSKMEIKNNVKDELEKEKGNNQLEKKKNQKNTFLSDTNKNENENENINETKVKIIEETETEKEIENQLIIKIEKDLENENENENRDENENENDNENDNEMDELELDLVFDNITSDYSNLTFRTSDSDPDYWENIGDGTSAVTHSKSKSKSKKNSDRNSKIIENTNQQKNEQKKTQKQHQKSTKSNEMLVSSSSESNTSGSEGEDSDSLSIGSSEIEDIVNEIPRKLETRSMGELSKNNLVYNPNLDFNGRFLKQSDKIYKYHNKILQFRKIPPQKIEIELVYNSNKFQTNLQTFGPQDSTKQVLEYYQTKDSSINDKDFGLVFTNHNDQDKEVFFIPPKEKAEREKIFKKLLEKSDYFGVWAKLNENYTLEGYLSKLPNTFNSIQFTLKPGLIKIILPDEREIEFYIDLNTNVKIFINKLIEYFSFEREILVDGISNEIIYFLFQVEYSNENGKQIISQLIQLQPNQSFSKQHIFNGSILKLSQDNIIKKKKTNEIKDVSINTDFWKEFGENQQNLSWWKNEENQKSTSSVSTKKNFLFNKIHGISLNKLIQYLTSPGYQNKELSQIFVVLLPICADENIVMERLMERYDVPCIHPQNNRNILSQEKNEIKRLVLKLILKVIKYNPYYFPIKAKKKLSIFYNEHLKISNIKEIQKLTKKISYYLENNSIDFYKININKKMKSAKKQKSFRTINLDKQKRKDLIKFSEENELTFDLINENEFARQITLFSHNLFAKITPQELFNQAWTKKNKMEQAPNVTKLITKFNFYSNWASTMILIQNDNEKRIKVFVKLVKIARQLKLLQNFHDMFAILSGLQSTPITRLTKLAKRVPKKIVHIFQQLDDLTDISHGYDRLKEFTKSCKLPVLPYLGAFTNDLAYISELPDYVYNNLFNWRKRMRIYEILRNIKKYQSVGFDFIYISNIQNYFENQQILDEDARWDISFQIEPRPKRK
ncbi:guanine nucleotide exchange factor [Anaeramoeba flamelloides]|uniref:Guanine nucleotide exchange factor n=1 Tax=Anaeramoeba flamelloides TaxID=1746091 RepID=A0AAV7Y7J8_9EUKA|nr:guanine nucleotide exchange factor [Anaeramoeba flamelloides]